MSKSAYFFLCITFIGSFFLVDNWRNSMYNGDSSGYYMHVVSAMVNQDVGDYSQTIADYIKHHPKAADPREDKFGIRKTEKDRYYIKYTLGVGIMELPAFFIAHLYVLLTQIYAADGWSPPYMVLVHLSKVIYILLGALLLSQVLRRYFSRSVVLATVVTLIFSTNLFYHGTFFTLSHSFLFFDYCLLIWLTVRFYDRPNSLKAIGIGAVVGLITITRVPEVVCCLVPLLWGVDSMRALKERVQFLVTSYRYPLLMVVTAMCVFAPQIAYWYFVSGHYVFNPYQGETFNFLKPNFIDGLFNFRNGWLVYTPVMGLALLGLISLRRFAAPALLPTLSIVLIIAWIHYSYYVWNYFPGMGSRPMIDTYALLSFGLASIFTVAFRHRIWQWVIGLLVVFFIWLNLFQSWQMRRGLIFTERHSKAFYLSMFGRTSSTPEALTTFDVKRSQPSVNDLVVVDTLFFNSFDDSTAVSTSREIAFSPPQSYVNITDETTNDTLISLQDTDLQPGDWIYVGVKAYRRSEDMVWNRDDLENLIVTFKRPDNTDFRYSAIKIASHIQNVDNSIWFPGAQDVWGSAGFFTKVPSQFKPDWKLRVFIHNPYKTRLFLDDMVIIHYRPR